MFYARENELRRIKERIKLDSFQSVLVYGRRRIGKTELIKEAIRIKNADCLMLLARNVNSTINFNDFVLQARDFIKDPFFNPKDYFDFFAKLFIYSKDHPFVLFIDEYSFLKEADSSIDSVFQKVIEYYKDDAKLTLILCGSYIDTMRQIVDIRSPLYGRFNEIICLRAFNYYDSSLFYSDLKPVERFMYYAVFGGTAYNIKNIDYSKSFERNLIDMFVRLDSFFEKEAISVIKGEVEKEGNVNVIFEAICNGIDTYKKLNELLGDRGKDNIGRYIRKLEELDLIDKYYDVNSEGERKARYVIKDNLLCFYYTFLYKNIRLRSIMDENVFFEKFIKKPFYEQYLPKKFEEVTKEFLIKENGKKNFFFSRIGRLVYNNNSKKINREFDVTTYYEGMYIPFECKFSKNKISINVVNEEKSQWKDLPFKVSKFGFASLSGFEEEVKKDDSLILISLEDMYK